MARSVPPPPASSSDPGPRAGAILAAALLAVDGEAAVRRTLPGEGRRLHLPGETLDLSRFSAVHLLGAGKCAPEMAAGAWAAVPVTPVGGVIVGPRGKAFTRPGIEYWTGGHPLPDEGSLAAGRAMLDYAAGRIGPSDLVIFLLSGGASALLALPRPGVSLSEKIALTRRLLALGVPIEEVNAVRRELSRIKGGKLAAAVPGAALLTLILDDIPGGDPAAVGSGPTMSPPQGAPSARRVLERYGLWADLPPSLRTTLTAEEPPAGRGAVWQRSLVVGSAGIALAAAAREAERLGYSVRTVEAAGRGEARERARDYASLLRREMALARRTGRARALLAAGEWTVTVRGRGRGGRNQEFMLALLAELGETPGPFLALSLGSDGIDGPTDAAGAWIDADTLARARRAGLDPVRFLADNDSYSFFTRLNQLVITGPTRTNVADLRLFLLEGANRRPKRNGEPS